MSLNKIAIAVHTYGHIEPMIYGNHIAVFSKWAKDYNIVFLSLDKAKVAQARNMLVEKAIDLNCTHILFIDSDHILDSSMLPYLLGNEEASAVSGLVVKTSEEHEQVGYVNYDNDGYSNNIQLPLDGKSYFVDACAFGCTLIKMDVFKELKKPYFMDETRVGKNGELFSQRSDVVFCRELKALGRTIMIDTRAQIGHVGRPAVYWPSGVENNKVYQLNTYKAAVDCVNMIKATSVLDLGCGTGNKLADMISPLCKDVTGVDSKELISVCKNGHYNKNIKWLVEDLEKELSSKSAYDVVICADVIEHLNNPIELIKTIINNMHENSYAIISTPDVDTVGSNCVQNKDHKQFWNKDSFIRLLEDNGLVVKEVRYEKEIDGYMSTICICTKI